MLLNGFIGSVGGVITMLYFVVRVFYTLNHEGKEGEELGQQPELEREIMT